jgi:hypothetical protein
MVRFTLTVQYRVSPPMCTNRVLIFELLTVPDGMKFCRRIIISESLVASPITQAQSMEL